MSYLLQEDSISKPLQEDGTSGILLDAVQTSPTVVLNTADATAFSTLSPALTFTGTDADGDDVRYNIQIDPANTFDSGTGTIDSYSQVNQDSTLTISGDTVNNFQGVGQAFTGNGATLGAAKLYLKKLGTPTGSATAKIYAVTGTFGTNAKPTGAALAVSGTLDISTLTTSFQLISFAFSGANQITLTNATNYVLTIETASGDVSNNIVIGVDFSSPSAAGNYATLFTATWTGAATRDICFYVYDNKTALINKISGTDAGFANTIHGADTDPFNSGDTISYTVQSALSAGTYYWRVAGIDPSGTNTYGAWATTRSFTASSATTYTTTLTESITITGALLKTAQRAPTEAVTLTDTLTKQVTRLLTEASTITDTITRTVQRALTDAATVTDSIFKTTQRTLADSITLTDSIIKGRLFSEAITVTGSLVKTMQRAVIEAITMTDTLLKTGQRALSEAVTLTDTFIRASTRTLAEAITATDTFIKTTQRALTEAVTATDTLITARLRFGLFTEAITLTDTVLKGTVKVLSDAITVTDTLLRATSRALSEAIIVTDTLIASTVRSKLLAEAITLSDTLLRATTKLLTEAFTVTDTILKSSQRTLSDAVTVTGTVLKSSVRLLTEMLFVTDGAGMVNNGNFENAPPFTAAQTSSNWIDGTAAGASVQNAYNVYASTSASTSSVRFDTDAHTGAYSLKIHIAPGEFIEAKAGVPFYNGTGGTALIPNTTYAYRVWMKSSGVSGSSSGQHVQILFSDASGSAATVTAPGGGTTTEFNMTGSITSNLGWTEYTGQFTTGAAAVWCHPEYRVYAHNGAATLTGDFWFDDMILVPIKTVQISLTRPLTEALTMTATLIKTLLRTLTESLTLTDVFSNSSKSATLSEVITLTATMLKSVTRTLTEALTATDTAIRSIAHTFTETITLTATLLKTAGKTLVETITLTATFTRGAAIVLRTYTESVTLTETLIKRLNGVNQIWSHVVHSADAAWAKVTKSVNALWTHIDKN